MNVRTALKLAAAASIAFGIALKLILAPLAESDPAALLDARVRTFLSEQGLEITGSRSNLDLTSLLATRPPDCHIAISLMAPQGWHGGVVKSMVPAGFDLFFVYDGKIYADQPVLQARTQLYITLLLHRLGVAAEYHPLLGVISQPSCHARDLPWSELARIRAPLSPTDGPAPVSQVPVSGASVPVASAPGPQNSGLRDAGTQTSGPDIGALAAHGQQSQAHIPEAARSQPPDVSAGKTATFPHDARSEAEVDEFSIR